MRTTLLSGCLFIACLSSRAQVICYVQEPPALQGNYDFSYAAWTATPDLLDPLNSVTDTIAFASDGGPADSLCCDPIVNGSDINGKIAVIYRGVCEFGHKALNAQNNGAVAVVIVTYAGQSPIAMGEGAEGAGVTIPVVMITRDAGIALQAAYENGEDIVMFIGNQQGFYADNVGFYKRDILMSRQSANPKLVSQDGSELNAQLGAWVHNYGDSLATGVTLHVTATQGGSVYDETGGPVDIASGDSTYISVADLALASYDGYYNLDYTVDATSGDDFPENNTFTADFFVDSLFSYAEMDEATEMPISGAHYQPSGATAGYTSCVHYRDANASRMAALGLWFSAATNAADSLDDEYVEITAYEWQDVFTDLDDPNLAFDNLNSVGTGEFNYVDNTLNGVLVYAPFQSPVMLQDDMRYLFCVTSFTTVVFLGHDDYFDYDEVVINNNQPISPNNDGATWYALGFGTDVSSSITVSMGNFDASVGESNENMEISAYPNPAFDMLRIPMNGYSGKASIRIMGLDGQLVAERSGSVAGKGELLVDVNNVANGNYLFDVRFEDGRQASFQVAVKK